MVYDTHTVNYFTIISLPLIEASLAEQDKRYVPVGRTVHSPGTEQNARYFNRQ